MKQLNMFGVDIRIEKNYSKCERACEKYLPTLHELGWLEGLDKITFGYTGWDLRHGPAHLGQYYSFDQKVFVRPDHQGVERILVHELAHHAHYYSTFGDASEMQEHEWKRSVRSGIDELTDEFYGTGGVKRLICGYRNNTRSNAVECVADLASYHVVGGRKLRGELLRGYARLNGPPLP